MCRHAMNVALDTAVRNAHQLRSKDQVCRLSAYLLEPERVFDMLGIIEATGSGCRSYTSEGDHQCPTHRHHRAKVVLGTTRLAMVLNTSLWMGSGVGTHTCKLISARHILSHVIE